MRMSSDTKEEVTPKTKVNLAKILLIIFSVLVLLLVLAYFGVAYYFKNRFLPNTVINGEMYGERFPNEVEEEIQSKTLAEYQLNIQARDGSVLQTLSAEDVDLTVYAGEQLAEIKQEQNALLWISSVIQKQSQCYETVFKTEFNEEKVRQTLEETGIFSEENVKAPENAYIGDYLAPFGQYELIEEKEGTILDKAVTLEGVITALRNGETVFDLAQAGCYVQPDIRSDNPLLLEMLAQMNKMVATKVRYDWNGSEKVLDGELIHEWISLADGEVLLDEEMVRAYVNEQAKETDTYGKKRNFVTTQGVELKLPSGAYGWRTDRKAETEELVQLIKEGAVTDREPQYTNKGYVKGKNDIGDSYVELDMTNQHLYLYIDGKLILETDFVSGNVERGNMTPPGVFGITYKTTDATLRGATYESHVDYWMPFNGNIGMHDASWRRKFGGEIFLTNGSHGCINLPPKKAAEIYKYMEKGFPVVGYYY